VEISNLFGLPAHPLIVHAVVVLVPLVALGAVGTVLWPALRERIGWIVVAGAVATAVLVPFATGSGETLQERVGETALLERHAELGDQLLPWAVGLAVAVLAFMLVVKRGQRWLGLVVAAATVVLAVGASVNVTLVGHSGAEATWAQVPTSGGDDG
jgi:hypothetical protein